MFLIRVRLRYPWPPAIPEEKEVAFVLSGEYPCRTAEDARAVVLRLIESGDPGFVLDADGVAWPFYHETVSGLAVNMHPDLDSTR